jgi:ABC-2 type transport system ATP-binding protein
MDAIRVENLRKLYGASAAVDGVTFAVRAGEVFALLGPNGAGKTTTVEILEGHRRRTSGVVEVLGYDPETGGRDYRERIGIVLQEGGMEEDFTVRELVRLYSGMYPRRLDVDQLIDLVGLADKRNARVKVLSGGQRRRLDLALGLVGDPELLFLDEPTTGFDPSARRHAWELIDGLRGRGKTVLLTTHYMDEAEHLADRVGVMQAGRLVAIGTPDEIGAGGGRCTIAFRLPEGVTPAELPSLGASLLSEGLELQLRTDSPTATLHTLTGWARDRGLDFPTLTVRKPSLEDLYLDLLGDDGGAGAVDPASRAPVGAAGQDGGPGSRS